MRRNGHMNAHADHILEEVQHPAEVLGKVNVSLTVAEILNALSLRFGTELRHAELFRPVRRIDHKRFAQARVCLGISDLFHKHSEA